MCTGNENSKPIWNKFIIRKYIIEKSQVVLNFCRTVYYEHSLHLRPYPVWRLCWFIMFVDTFSNCSTITGLQDIKREENVDNYKELTDETLCLGLVSESLSLGYDIGCFWDTRMKDNRCCDYPSTWRLFSKPSHWIVFYDKLL